MSAILPLDLVSAVVVLWLVLAVLGVAAQASPRFVTKFVFPLGACASLILLAAAFRALDRKSVV